LGFITFNERIQEHSYDQQGYAFEKLVDELQLAVIDKPVEPPKQHHESTTPKRPGK
jgi:hypothetical protein